MGFPRGEIELQFIPCVAPLPSCDLIVFQRLEDGSGAGIHDLLDWLARPKRSKRDPVKHQKVRRRVPIWIKNHSRGTEHMNAIIERKDQSRSR